MAWPPDPIAADKAPGLPDDINEHPDHHNALATAINDTVTYVETLSTSEAGELIYFLEDEDDPLIANYKVMDNPAQLIAEAYVAQSTVSDGAIVQTWITDAGLPGATFIPGGAWAFHINAYKTGGTRTVRLYNEMYQRDLAGTETLLGTTASSIALTDVEVALPAFNIYIPGLTLLVTDRIVTKTRINLTGGGSNPTSVTVGYSGSTAARLSLPSQAVDATRFVTWAALAEADIDGGTPSTVEA